MFDDTSRYANVPTATLAGKDGKDVAYKRRRLLPQASALPQLGDVLVRDGERIDLIAARALGDPEQFWRIADANDAMDATDLAAEPGRALRVPLPQPGV